MMHTVAAESGVERARQFREKAEQAQRQADHFRRLAENCEKGVEGEQEVARLLDVLEGAGWRVLHDRCKAAGSPANIDHLAVGPPGVFVIDAKCWSGGPVHLDDRGMAHRGRRRDEVLHGAVHATQIVATHARQAELSVVGQGVLAFVGDAGPAAPVTHQGLALLRADHLLQWLTDQPARLDARQVQRVASTLDAALPPRTGGSALPSPVPAVQAAGTRARRAPRTVAAPRPSGGGSRRVRSGRRAGRRRTRTAAALLLVVLALQPEVRDSLADGIAGSLPARPSPAASVPQAPAPPVVPPG